jgi:hypothetical protein
MSGFVVNASDALDTLFRHCPGCGRALRLRDLLESPEFEAVGMSFEGGKFSAEFNSYYFNHKTADCGTTLCVPVDLFVTLIPETIPEQVLSGTEACEKHCVRVDDLSACQQDCHYAPFRRFLLARLIRSSVEPRQRRSAVDRDRL